MGALSFAGSSIVLFPEREHFSPQDEHGCQLIINTHQTHSPKNLRQREGSCLMLDSQISMKKGSTSSYFPCFSMLAKRFSRHRRYSFLVTSNSLA